MPHYCALPTLEEVWLIDSQRALLLDWQKRGGQWIGSLPLQPGQHFPSDLLGPGDLLGPSDLLGGESAVADLFLGTGLEAPDFTPPPASPADG